MSSSSPSTPNYSGTRFAKACFAFLKMQLRALQLVSNFQSLNDCIIYRRNYYLSLFASRNYGVVSNTLHLLVFVSCRKAYISENISVHK